MLTPKRYQVGPAGGGGKAHPTPPPTKTTGTTTTPPAAHDTRATGAAHGAAADASRRLVGMTGGNGTVTAKSVQGQELTATRDRFHQLTDSASQLVRQSRELIGNRDLADLSPKELKTVRANLDKAAHQMAEARGIMQAVRGAYPNQSNLWVRSGKSQTEMWNFSGAETNLAVGERGLRNTALIIDNSPFAYSDGLLATARTPPTTGATTPTAVAGPRRTR